MTESVFEIVYKLSLIVTLGVLIWYTIETKRIRLIATEQRDLQLLPSIMLYLRDESGSKRLKVRNIGAGAALNVKILPETISDAERTWAFRFSFTDMNDTLIPGQEGMVSINWNNEMPDGMSSLGSFLASHDPELLDRANFSGTHTLSIEFSDVTGQKYHMGIAFSKNGISVEQPAKRI